MAQRSHTVQTSLTSSTEDDPKPDSKQKSSSSRTGKKSSTPSSIGPHEFDADYSDLDEGEKKRRTIRKKKIRKAHVARLSVLTWVAVAGAGAALGAYKDHQDRRKEKEKKLQPHKKIDDRDRYDVDDHDGRAVNPRRLNSRRSKDIATTNNATYKRHRLNEQIRRTKGKILICIIIFLATTINTINSVYCAGISINTVRNVISTFTIKEKRKNRLKLMVEDLATFAIASFGVATVVGQIEMLPHLLADYSEQKKKLKALDKPE